MASKLYEIAFQIAGKVNSSFKSSTASASEKLRDINSEVRKLNKMDESYNKGTAAAKKFAMSQAEVKKRLSEIIPLQNKLNRQVDLSRKIQANQGALSQKRGQLFDAVALGATLAAPVNQAIQFESAMANVRKVVDGLDDEQKFKAMQKEILGLTRVIPMANIEIAQLYEAGGQAGFAAEDLKEFATAAGKMGVAFDNLTAQQAGEMMAQWRTAFRYNQKEVNELADTINFLSNKTATSSSKISEVVSRIGPLGEVAGYSSKAIAALGTTLTSASVAPEIASTGIKNFLLALASGTAATKTQKEMYAKLGMTSTQVAHSLQKDAQKTSLYVLKAISKLKKEEQTPMLQELFGKESITAIAPLLTNLDSLQKNFALVADKTAYAGSMNKEFETRSKTTANNIQLSKNRLGEMAIMIGNVLLPPLNDLLSSVLQVSDKIMAFAEKNKTVFDMIVKVTAGLMAFKIASIGITYAWLLLKGGVLQAISVFGKIFGVVGKLFSLFRMISIFLIANPWFAAIMAIAVAAFLIYKNWDTIKAWLLKAWEVISAKFTEAWLVIKEIGIGVWEALKGAFMAYVNFWKTGITWIVEWFQGLNLYDSGVKMIETLVNGIKAMASYPVEVIKGIFSKVGEYLPHSDADKGPLSTLTASGAAIVDTMAQGARRAASNNNIGAAAAGGFSPVDKISIMADTAGTGVGGMTISYSPTIYVSGPDAAQNKAAVESGLKSGLDDFSKRMKDFLSQEKRLSYA